VDIELLALLVLGLVAGVAATELVIRRSDAGAALVLGYLVANEADLIDVAFNIGALNVYDSDLLRVVIVAAAAARLLRLGRLTPAQWVLLGFGLVLLWSVYRGVEANGVAAAVNEARKYITFTAVTLYFSTVEPRQEVVDRLLRMVLWAAAALAALTLLRWGANAAGVTGGILGDGSSMRVIPSDSALIVACGALVALPALRRSWPGWIRYATPVLLVFVVLLQHRTVWVVTAAAFLYLLSRTGRLDPRVVGGLASALVVFAVLVFTVFDAVEEGIAEQLSTAATQTNTFEWRVAGWHALLTDAGPQTGPETVTGRPFGGGWERRVDGNRVDVSPHNFYIETYLRMGLAGVLGLITLYTLALRSPRRGTFGGDGLASRDLFVTLAGAQLIYYITYTPDGAQAMLLGLACAVATAGRPVRKARATAPAPASA
jgi:hypothetical protein